MSIRTNQLGRTDLDITVLGFGAWAIGGQWEYGWGKQDDKDSIATMHAAIEKGINWIDTAPAYGLGHSEELIGHFLKELPVSERPLIFTKCGRVWKEGAGKLLFDLSPVSIRREVEMSLRRMKIDVIDLYQIHWPVPDADVEAAWETLAELKETGKIRHIGVSNFSASQLDRASNIAAVETVQPNYSLISRGIETDILPWCAAHNTGVICYSPMASGMLSGKMTRERIAAMPDDDWRIAKSDMLKEPQLSHNLALVDVLNKIGNQYGRSAGEIAIAWVLSRSEVSAAITGMRHPGQTSITAAADVVLDDNDLDIINRFIAKN